jgi:hypothetical protein
VGATLIGMLAPRVAMAAVFFAACGGGKKDGGPVQVGTSDPAGGPAASACADVPVTADRMPGVDPPMEDVGYWASRLDDPDGVVLTPDEVANLAAAHQATPPASASAPLTRRTWLTAALTAAGQPASGAPVEAVLTSLGLPPAGSFRVDVGSVRDPDERLVLIDAAARAGVVVLEAGDHRMIWLGRDAGGVPRVVHAVDAYPVRCGGGEAKVEVGRVVVSGLELGSGTAAGSWLDRLTTVTVFGRSAGPDLAGVVTERAAAPVAAPGARTCRDSAAAAIFFSPARPNRQQPLRVIATLSRDPGPVELVLIDPDGRRHAPSMVRIAGPPFTYVIEVDAPAVGAWTAVLGDGSRVDACATAKVSARRQPRKGTDATVWPGKRNRTEATENLFAAFVQRLFDYPVDQDLTWPDLHSLLRDRDHNLLHDHLSHGEEAQLVLSPDCADLPYMLHAYFSWKLDLPFSFVVCSMGTRKSPPRCRNEDEDRPPGDNLMSRATFKKQDEVGAFGEFARRVFRGVSSSAGRVAPKDELTDWYPVPLTREALRPGTMFADPYGHLLVLAGWYPQAPGGYGILMGADAQPDGTIGRRRFWRGNYLFTADTSRAGSGWKAYRPRVRKDGALVSLDNKTLGSARGWWTPWSHQQYDGTTDDFYDAMEALINPRPLDALQMQVSLVDALQEAVVRRVNSVDNGERFMATRTSPIDMPSGAKIFITSGPWEDYSTPSRDHRILIAIDTVLGLEAAVRRQPERFRVDAAAVPDLLARLDRNLQTLLAGRKFTYTRTDGSSHELTLADVVARATAFEVAYNPNDCAEIRWGAPEGSAELQTCKRRAPADQRRKMEEYRVWFAKRERPVD